ncbi:hypothetical protein V8E51_013253 [Hyaloscypha variabilis]|jgi:hypothetical protein|uniref:Uncharacterized protein n=1 Tax=Hyaloscypha variabilis (strain UAMH 11265 / GT02V1 / F) TaxID=1149755 RepID=A0A2J6RGE2_HYAVF|nr:hypothetical protein L207DRAFT_514789 [Hyaloscypha variabilis F]
MGEIGDHYRDLKEHRKQQKEKKLEAKSNPPLRRRRCWDWIVVGGDYHYAKNRSSFKEYHRIKAKIGLTRVIGIGTIELFVERKDSTPYTLVLEDVLHTPSAVCNGFNPSLTNCRQTWTTNDTVEGKDTSGQSLWHARNFFGLPRLVIVNNPEGDSLIEKAKAKRKLPFSLSLVVNQEERDKIEDQNMVMVQRDGGASLDATEDEDVVKVP